MDWTQRYNPTGSEALSTLLAALPIVVLLGLLGLFRWSAPRAALAGLLTALAVAVWAFDMPREMALAAAACGACFGLFPIGWIVLTSVFLYTLTVEAGQFEKIKSSVANLSPDRRIQALLIAFNFGAFMEGCAGFGAPVAISSALMIGIGFPPLYAAGLALLANTAPVAFGSLGTPIITLASVTGIHQDVISVMAGRQLPFFSLLIPAWMVVTMAGWARAARGVAGRARGGRELCGSAVLDVAELRADVGRRCRRFSFAGRDGRVLAILEAANDLALCRRAGGHSRSGCGICCWRNRRCQDIAQPRLAAI